MPSPDEFRRLLADPGSTDRLLPLVYEELRAVAGALFRGQPASHTLQPTALVHEAWFKLAGDDAAKGRWENRRHFMAVAAKAMRQILINHAEARGAAKRGGGWDRVTLAGVGTEGDEVELLALNEALEALEQLDERQCRVVELRYFAGLSVEETAEVLGIGARTVKLDWRMAKAWLKDRLEGAS